MKRVLVESVFDAFEYVMSHYYPAGMEEMVEKSDTYAVISIQDSHTDGFGIIFSENQYCKAVLTLIFDDIIRPVDGAQIFTEEMAKQIIRFIRKHKDVDTLLIHCYAGQSRSRAVGAFAVKFLGGNNSVYFKKYSPNEYVYELLTKTLPEVREYSEEDIEDFCVSLYEPDMSEEVLAEITYTGTEFSDAYNNLQKFCQDVPAEGSWLSYLCDADELHYLYGKMSSILEEEPTEEDKKKLAVYSREIDRMVN
ncbi:MAG: hypothetical protein ACI4GD_09295 [Lachnospiraceae bacterium]